MAKLPPLLPRKPSINGVSPIPPPPRRVSAIPPPIPPPLESRPVVSPLIQQSFMTSKTTKTVKKVEEQLKEERVLQVLRSSAVSTPFSNGSTSRDMSPSKRGFVTKSDSRMSSWSGSEHREKPPARR